VALPRNRIGSRWCAEPKGSRLDHFAEDGGKPRRLRRQCRRRSTGDSITAICETSPEGGLELARAQAAEDGIKAMMLSPTLQICRALLAGERVPWQLLDQAQARRYGLRSSPLGDGRVSLAEFWNVRRPA